MPTTDPMLVDFHADLLTPWQFREIAEYNDYPQRGCRKDGTCLRRIIQFGVRWDPALDTCESRPMYGLPAIPADSETYLRKVGAGIKEHCCLVVTSVFDPKAFPSLEQADPAGDVDFDQEGWSAMEVLIERYKLMAKISGIRQVHNQVDLHGNVRTRMVLCLENGAHLIRSIERVYQLIEWGVRIFGLQYNTDTPLATGKGGLTDLGRSACLLLWQRLCIVDLAHSSPATRLDVLDLARETGNMHRVCYSHGSLTDDLMESWRQKAPGRCLSAHEATRILSEGGFIGLSPIKPFFADFDSFLSRLIEMSKWGAAVGIGSDFGGIPPKLLFDEVRGYQDIPKLAVRLAERGLGTDQVDDLIRDNAFSWLSNALEA